MKPVTSQDTKWTRLQTTQGPKHQHVKLRGLGCLPTRSTQPERYSRSPGQHDHSLQIRRLKRPLMAKVWLPMFCASTIPSIWKCGRTNSGQGARIYDPRIPVASWVRNQNRLSSKAHLEILSSFPRNVMNTKVGENFVPYNQDTEFALFGVRTWEIWRWQGRSTNQESLDEAVFLKPSSLLSLGRYRGRKGGARPKAPQRHKYNPLGAQGGAIDLPTRRRSTGRKLTTAVSPQVA
jgi:hypothetical protein